MYFENLHPDAYHYLLKKGICLIGNSSSGIIEAPSLGIYTINIGDRQNVERNILTEFNSSNTELLDVEQVKEKLLTLQYIRDELAEWENR